jgi:hypothetical protein
VLNLSLQPNRSSYYTSASSGLKFITYNGAVHRYCLPTADDPQILSSVGPRSSDKSDRSFRSLDIVFVLVYRLAALTMFVAMLFQLAKLDPACGVAKNMTP